MEEVWNQQVLQFVETQMEIQMGTEAQALSRNSQVGEQGTNSRLRPDLKFEESIACDQFEICAIGCD